MSLGPKSADWHAVPPSFVPIQRRATSILNCALHSLALAKRRLKRDTSYIRCSLTLIVRFEKTKFRDAPPFRTRLRTPIGFSSIVSIPFSHHTLYTYYHCSIRITAMAPVTRRERKLIDQKVSLSLAEHRTVPRKSIR